MLLEEEQMWDLELLITMALFQKSPSFLLLVGIFFSAIPTTADLG